MTQIAITVKIDSELKDEVQALAKRMGLSMSALVEGKLREVARERKVVFEVWEPWPNPDAELAAKWDHEVAAMHKQEQHSDSQAFTNAKEALAHLNAL